MSVELQDLLILLTQEKDCYSQLLDLAGDKKKAIIADQVTRLDQIVSQEESTLANLKKLENSRLDFIRQTAARCRIPEKDLTLSQWPFPTSSEEKQQIDALQTGFKQIITTLAEQNQLNNRLIDMHFMLIDQLLFKKTQTKTQLQYTPNGGLDQTRNQTVNLIDRVM
ncbi:MAG: flagellar protein FlgN [Clostridiaceae bacterium]|nr:flagellar protein FlgN [Clostridiaceae bacterium]